MTFVGLPSLGAAGLIASTVLLHQHLGKILEPIGIVSGLIGFITIFVPIFTFVTAPLMISSIRYSTGRQPVPASIAVSDIRHGSRWPSSSSSSGSRKHWRSSSSAMPPVVRCKGPGFTNQERFQALLLRVESLPPMRDNSMLRTRFAPSPTGHLHVGGARTALFCWAYARGRDGRFPASDRYGPEAFFRCRRARVLQRPQVAGHRLGRRRPRLRNVRWGRGWVHRQSQRLPIYDKWMQSLIESGQAYPAFETPEEPECRREKAGCQTALQIRPRRSGPGCRYGAGVAGSRSAARHPIPSARWIDHDQG